MLEEHLGYVADHQRTRRFQAAIAETLRRGDHVLDLGCGVGVLGMLSLEAGASRVTAIDNTDIVQVARKVYDTVAPDANHAVALGYADQIDVSEQADLIICDHVGYFALDYGVLGLLQDARSRFLKPGGKLLPQGARLYLSAVGSEKCAKFAYGWSQPGVPSAFHWLNSMTTNSKFGLSLNPNDVMADPVELELVDFRSETRRFFSWDTELVVSRGGELHGLAGWFECMLSPTVTMTNSPLANDKIDRPQAFFPIAEPIEVSEGDQLLASIAFRPAEHFFAWTLEHKRTGIRFRHSTMHSQLFERADILRTARKTIPQPTRNARAAQVVMQYCDGHRTVEEIEHAVLTNHPDLFPTQAAISAFVLSWLSKWSE